MIPQAQGPPNPVERALLNLWKEFELARDLLARTRPYLGQHANDKMWPSGDLLVKIEELLERWREKKL